MSERKVLSKYYPPDFDPSAIGRTKKPKDAITKLPTVRLMAPFSMKCATCGEYIYRGRKFNARKETLQDESYYSIKIHRFYIRCTRCSAELTFKTDPKNNDYAAEKGIRRNFEVWREDKLAEETEEERLDRIEREEAERDPMKELEAKTMDAKTEMAIADKLDEIRTRNARLERAGKERDGEVPSVVVEERDLERERLASEDEEAAKAAFKAGTGEKVKRLAVDEEHGDGFSGNAADVPDEVLMPPPTFIKAKKRKQDFGAALGIKKKKPVLP